MNIITLVSNTLTLEQFSTAINIIPNTESYLLNDTSLPHSLIAYVNHSCDPNCIFSTTFIWDPRESIVTELPTVESIRKIQPGEFLNVDYNWFPVEGVSEVKCNCKATNCKFWLRPPFEQERQINNKRKRE
jgi:hypothetical protein